MCPMTELFEEYQDSKNSFGCLIQSFILDDIEILGPNVNLLRSGME